MGMEFPFSALPRGRSLRPIVPFRFADLPQAIILGLVDSGASGTRIPGEFAKSLGVDLDEIQPEEVSIGLGTYAAYPCVIPIKVRNDIRDTRVHFMSGWPHSHAILGVGGFFDNYIVRIDARKNVTQLRAHRR